MRVLHICEGGILLVAILAQAQQPAKKANQGTPSELCRGAARSERHTS